VRVGAHLGVVERRGLTRAVVSTEV
jgi:hypothetical protein